MRPITRRTSDAVASIHVSIKDARARVTFKSGSVYDYRGVSRRAIINLLLNPSMSLGFWVNRNCVNPDRYVTWSPNVQLTNAY